MLNAGGNDSKFEERLRTLRILWAIFILTIGMYALVSYFASREEGVTADENVALLYALLATGCMSILTSFFVKSHFYAKAARESDLQIAQTGFIAAAVLSEVAAIMGLLVLFMHGSSLAYVMYVLSVVALILHFPRRAQLPAATRVGEAGRQF